MNDQLFQTFYNEMKKEPFKDDRIKLLNAALAGSDFTSAQCLQLTKLYTFDDDGVDYIYSESFATGGIGSAIMNRLLKAAGHHVINIQ